VTAAHAARHLNELRATGVGVELLVTGADLDGEPGALHDLARRIERSGLPRTLHAPFLKLAAGAVDAEVSAALRRRLEATLAVAEVLRPAQVVVHPGFDEARYPAPRAEEAAVEHCVGLIAWLEDRLAGLGSRVAVENLFAGPKALAAFLERLPASARVCLDVGHAHALSRTPLEAWVERLAPRVVQLHLHDNDGSWDQHLAVGEGSIDWQATLAHARALGEGTYWVIEARDEAAARRSLERLGAARGG
jgi:sugar phosphate isomerase/epimerase